MTPTYAMLSLSFFFATTLIAEPWISNRYAQNCAGCHAPGRKNLPAADRRCTLSCQGCHVNPNGGGLRNHYGKWNENRWLRSFRSEAFDQEKTPAPYKKQAYAKPSTGSSKANDEDESRKRRRRQIKVAKVKTIPESDVDETAYDRSDGLEHTIATRYEFLQQVPREDPYYLMERNKIDAGVDVRWQTQRGTVEQSSESGTGDGKTKLWTNFLMVADYGLRWRPVYKGYHLVYEGRYLGSPYSKKTSDVAATSIKRSFYFMADDLPFNTYTMAGYYRPRFGAYVPDHTALTQKLLSSAYQDSPSQMYNVNWETVSIGGSPNVPYANVHLIGRQYGAKPNDTHRGIAFNLGGRFVTLGASINYSYWNSEKEEIVADEEVTTRLQMHGLNMGMQIWRITTNLELISITKDIPNDSFQKGVVGSFDTYTRLWRQMYLTTQYAQSNIAEDLGPGTAQQFRIGPRAFLLSGMDVMLLFASEKNTINKDGDTREGRDIKTDEILWQLHMYM